MKCEHWREIFVLQIVLFTKRMMRRKTEVNDIDIYEKMDSTESDLMKGMHNYGNYAEEENK